MEDKKYAIKLKLQFDQNYGLKLHLSQTCFGKFVI